MAIVLQSIWSDAMLHLWGYRIAPAGRGEGSPLDRGDNSLSGGTPFAVSVEELRRITGDLWDSLLISGAADSSLSLRLPSRNGEPVRPGTAAAVAGDSGDNVALCTHLIPTLAVSPADAVDLLTSLPTFEREDIRSGASLSYWSRAAGLVLELLARQRFAPALHRAAGDRFRAYWRVMVNDAATSDRMRMLITSMPPVCRSVEAREEQAQAASLVENFLFCTVDALVRRCLEGDELTHAIHEGPTTGSSAQMRWLRALVAKDAVLQGTAEECRFVYESVDPWLSKLEETSTERTYRTCFRLHEPHLVDDSSNAEGELRWRLSLHVQALHDPSLVLDAASLAGEHRDDPTILERPFRDALHQLRADVSGAAERFPPLAACAEAGGPLECNLTLEESYGFLRDMAPVLEAEGFGVYVPRWWTENRPRVGMRLDIRPASSNSSADTGTLGLDALVEYDWCVALGDEKVSLEEITRLANTKEPLVRVKGRWMEVRESEVKTAMRFLERNRPGKMTVFEAFRLSYVADDLDTGLPVTGIQAHGWVERLLNATTADESIEHVEQPAGFHGELRGYQRKGLDWLHFLSRHGLGACLADDMGLGKTIQMIALWLHEREAGDSPGPTLLVVPMSLVGNWKREIERFAPSLKVMVHHGLERLTGDRFVAEVATCDVVISTYALTYRDFEHLQSVQWHRVALDEAQNIKNPAAKQSTAVRSLRAVHRLALTGTPVENRLTELWSIIDFLNPGYLGTASDFRRRFAVPIERHRDNDRAQRLRELIRPLVLRRLKEDPDILDDLPEKLEMTVYCNLTREQAALYESVVGNMMGQIDDAGGIQRKGLILAAIVRLKQICNHPEQYLSEGGAMAHRSGKCDRIVEMLEEVVAEGHRALVFTQYRRMGELLKKHLQESLDREMLFFHGGISRKQRDQLIEQFQLRSDRTPILILTLKAGGYGLNLTAANHVFHYDRWWNPAVENQATDRAHRIGQDKQVQVHRFICIGTLEERIAALIERKTALAENIVGKGEDWLTELSTEQLRELFSLSREAVAQQ